MDSERKRWKAGRGHGAGTACTGLLPFCPGHVRHSHQQGIGWWCPGVGKGHAAGLEGSAEGGDGGVKSVFVRDLGERRGVRDARAGAGPGGWGTPLVATRRAHWNNPVVPAEVGVALQGEGGGAQAWSLTLESGDRAGGN